MVVILYHAADRNFQIQPVQDPQGHIHLAPAAVHHDEIRKGAEFSKFFFQSLLFNLLLLVKSMGKTPRQHFLHAGVIVRPLDRLDLKLPVITPFGLASLIDYHGTDGLETADVGNIVGLHPGQLT